MNGVLLGIFLLAPALVKITPPAAPLAARPGRTLEVPVRFTIAAGYHINSNKPSLDYLIPTRVEWSPSALKPLGDAFPQAELKSFSFAPDQKLAVYEGTQELKSRFSVPAGASPGKFTLAGKLRYQACDDKSCYPPASVEFQIPLEIFEPQRHKDTKKK